MKLYLVVFCLGIIQGISLDAAARCCSACCGLVDRSHSYRVELSCCQTCCENASYVPCIGSCILACRSLAAVTRLSPAQVTAIANLSGSTGGAASLRAAAILMDGARQHRGLERSRSRPTASRPAAESTAGAAVAPPTASTAPTVTSSYATGLGTNRTLVIASSAAPLQLGAVTSAAVSHQHPDQSLATAPADPVNIMTYVRSPHLAWTPPATPTTLTASATPTGSALPLSQPSSPTTPVLTAGVSPTMCALAVPVAATIILQNARPRSQTPSPRRTTPVPGFVAQHSVVRASNAVPRNAVVVAAAV